MPDAENGRESISILTERVAELERRNGEDHRTMRENIHDLELKFAEQKGQLASIMSTLTEVKLDSKSIIERITNISTKVDKIHDLENDVKHLETDVDKIQGKSGETWESIKKQGLGWLVGIILAIVAAALGLSKFL